LLCVGPAVVVGLLVAVALAMVGSFVAMAAVAWELHGCWGRDCARGWEDIAAPIAFVGAALFVLLVAPILAFRTGVRCWRRLADSSAAPQHEFYVAVAMAVPTVAVSMVLGNWYLVALSLALAFGCGILVLTIKVGDWALSR
jgi:hypothetical protein